MRTVLFAAAATVATLGVVTLGMTLNMRAASATDIVNQDEIAYTLTLTDSDGSHDIEVAAGSEVQDACEGCTITLEGIEPVVAGVNDAVLIVDGAISIQE